MSVELLENRSLLTVSGEDAAHFLENLVTCSVESLQPGDARFGALLTPQGKILYDFFLLKTADEFLLEVPSSLREEIIRRLTFYRLRAKVEIAARDDLKVFAGDAALLARANHVFADPRHAALDHRGYGNDIEPTSTGDYLRRRIETGIPEGGFDFEYGDAYPHETLMDQFGGVDFRKGCYVGQEVVSRMQHRSTARKRVIKLHGKTTLPQQGSPVLADGIPAGTLGSSIGNLGLALVRLDRLAGAEEILAGEMSVSPELQDWVTFKWPGQE